jgi:hypothetical protein
MNMIFKKKKFDAKYRYILIFFLIFCFFYYKIDLIFAMKNSEKIEKQKNSKEKQILLYQNNNKEEEDEEKKIDAFFNLLKKIKNDKEQLKLISKEKEEEQKKKISNQNKQKNIWIPKFEIEDFQQVSVSNSKNKRKYDNLYEINFSKEQKNNKNNSGLKLLNLNDIPEDE